MLNSGLTACRMLHVDVWEKAELLKGLRQGRRGLEFEVQGARGPVGPDRLSQKAWRVMGLSPFTKNLLTHLGREYRACHCNSSTLH